VGGLTELELELDRAGASGAYEVRVLRSAAGGEPARVMHLDVDELLRRRPHLETSVLASAVRSRRGAVSEAEAPLRQVGKELFDAVFVERIESTYRASLAVARERGSPLRIVLRLTAPELAALPWETLFDPELGTYVCRREPLVRHVPAVHTPAPLPVDPPLRILGLVASPSGLAPLDVTEERRHLDVALAELVAAGTVEITWLTDASWRAVHHQLLAERWHVLHLISHGDYDVEQGEGRIALVGDEGRADWIEASRLVDLLDEAAPTPRLVVLNSCSSAQGGGEDEFSGTAASIARRGIAAVAAMQFTVSDGAAVAFPHGFYGALAAGRGVDEAVRSGRISILGAPGSLEWVTPVLYLRGNTGRIFDVDTVALEDAGVEPANAPRDVPRAAARAGQTTPAPPPPPPPRPPASDPATARPQEVSGAPAGPRSPAEAPTLGVGGGAPVGSAGGTTSVPRATLVSRSKREVLIELTVEEDRRWLRLRNDWAVRLLLDDRVVGWSVVGHNPHFEFDLPAGGQLFTARCTVSIGRLDARIRQLSLVIDGREVLRDPR
jgi:hypothetical protein